MLLLAGCYLSVPLPICGYAPRARTTAGVRERRRRRVVVVDGLLRLAGRGSPAGLTDRVAKKPRVHAMYMTDGYTHN